MKLEVNSNRFEISNRFEKSFSSEIRNINYLTIEINQGLSTIHIYFLATRFVYNYTHHQVISVTIFLSFIQFY